MLKSLYSLDLSLFLIPSISLLEDDKELMSIVFYNVVIALKEALVKVVVIGVLGSISTTYDGVSNYIR